jgi:hypothetical protein
MTGKISDLGLPWTEMAADTDAQVAALRRRAREMAMALDRAARRDIEGASDWRDLQNTGDRYAD